MKSITLFAALCAFAGGLAPAAHADQWNHETRVTFSQPVEIPSMVLPAGKYVFKIYDSQADRGVVQVFNEDQSHLYATILALADYRAQLTGDTVIMFEEREAGAPQAVRAWFYPGENWGVEFVYPQPQAASLAKANNLPVPSMPATEKPREEAELRQAPVTRQQPSGEQTAVEPARAPQPPHEPAQEKAQAPATMPHEQPREQAQAQVPTPQEQPQEQAAMRPQRLPQTASELPLVGLMGLLSLALAVTFRFIRRREVQ